MIAKLYTLEHRPTCRWPSGTRPHIMIIIIIIIIIMIGTDITIIVANTIIVTNYYCKLYY